MTRDEAPDVTQDASRTVFELWRQDDNGNRFLMSGHPDRATAEAAVAAMEAGVQHKQLYFLVERAR
ncbi:hypothetical protein Caci_5544 [Catenulispora acidiphila DSM 44928]|uniref:SPOR domain-containing protein n=1 Tax=Catenulispora acidiphila (strain DSM 44928 / JCM 14897 / NBRC 102108 / NRRL B-24433 / ID139908) TaxID=479433 RepID=C7QAT0_CATAD|nr:hypothetical protein [Catenulispora acidiphila]ACU74403.1 hypothetical protein Caci_5544 [Catenulispora acidiphila DSM 44928]